MRAYTTIEEARAFFADDRVARDYGMKIEELSEESCLCSMELTDIHKNALGDVMGGVTFAFGDFAFAVAANRIHRPTVSMTVTINYLSQVRGKVLYARSRRVKDGFTTCVYDIDITDDLGRPIAQFVATGYKKR